jgi:hypothetical protein
MSLTDMLKSTGRKLTLALAAAGAVVPMSGCEINQPQRPGYSEQFDSYGDLVSIDAGLFRYSPERFERFQSAYGGFEGLNPSQRKATEDYFSKGSAYEHEIFVQCYENADSVKRLLDKASGEEGGYKNFGKKLARKNPQKLAEYSARVPWKIGNGNNQFSAGDDLALYFLHVMDNTASKEAAEILIDSFNF